MNNVSSGALSFDFSYLPQTQLLASAGNLLSDGEHTFSWDAENRLHAVTPANATNGSLKVVNWYDHRHRRVTKEVFELSGYTPPYGEPPVPGDPGEWGLLRTHNFFYDGWNLVRETVAHTNGSVDRIEYVWGLDLSGTLQGAGGVGGLLFEKRNGQIYIPLYDANGNVTAYVDANGTVRGHFEYDVFGKVIAQTGDMADAFCFRFSTKYFDAETGLYYYGYRFYSPELGRWINRDPIGENGGLKLYGFVGNDPINRWDYLGLKQTIIKSCNVSIYVGHNYAVPQTSIENEPCSAGKVISCGGYTSWDPATPDTEIPGLPPQNKGKSSISVNEAIDQTQKAFLAGVEYARETICKSDTCCCKKVTVKIICNFGADIPLRLLFGKFGHGLCNKTETVKCGR